MNSCNPAKDHIIHPAWVVCPTLPSATHRHINQTQSRIIKVKWCKIVTISKEGGQGWDKVTSVAFHVRSAIAYWLWVIHSGPKNSSEPHADGVVASCLKGAIWKEAKTDPWLSGRLVLPLLALSVPQACVSNDPWEEGVPAAEDEIRQKVWRNNPRAKALLSCL